MGGRGGGWRGGRGGGGAGRQGSGHYSQFIGGRSRTGPACRKKAQGILGLFKNAEIDLDQVYGRWLNVLLAPVLKGSAVASVIFWASAVSSLVCSVSVSSCLRE